MKIIFSFLTISLLPFSLLCQPKLPGQWSLAFDFGYSLPASSGMNGSSSEFQQEVQRNYNNKSYPFGDKRAISTITAAMVSYRFPSTAWSIYGAEYGFVSTVDNGFAKYGFLSENAELDNVATVLGAEYTFGEPSERLNAFGRFGIGFSLFSGNVNYSNSHVDLAATFRGGVDLGIGGRWNWSFAPLAIEASVSYYNANLVGKSYQAPDATPPSQILERALNDGKNPNDPNDVSRTIAYLSFRLGGRVWF